jgi:predicted MFS family arabinose efflux permease
MSTTPGLSSPPAAAHPSLRGHFIGFMALACGVSVANIYYAQPLLEQFARQFHTTVAGVAAVPSATQIGYAAGLLLLGPLGDRHARHRVILLMAALLVPALLGAALARSVLLLAAASFAIGMLSSIAQQIIPLVAALAAPQSRGKAIGLVMSGLLVGILGGRVLAGAIASAFDWQAVFVFAATVNAGMWLLLWRVLPRLPVDPAAARQSYAALLRSTLRQFALHRELRLAGLTGGLFFASFSVFWVGLTPLLQSPAYGYGPAVVGAFGVLGIMGAAVAPVSGRYSDRPGGPRRVLLVALSVTLLAWAVFAAGTHGLWWLVAGVLLLDAGVQGSQIANQTRIYALDAAARSRINAVYMTLYFIGGSAGSFVASHAWTAGGWPAVTAAGAAFALAALLLHAAGGRGAGASAT